MKFISNEYGVLSYILKLRHSKTKGIRFLDTVNSTQSQEVTDDNVEFFDEIKEKQTSQY